VDEWMGKGFKVQGLGFKVLDDKNSGELMD
jgi:hypothetical protein